MHVLSFRALGASSAAKPEGASRLELFAQIVPPGEPIPLEPDRSIGLVPGYLRSFTRSPFKVEAPIPREPMLIVYWGRWADSSGNVGPFSETVVSRIEGSLPYVWSHRVMGTKPSLPILESPPAARPQLEPSYSVAVRDAQYEYLDQPATTAPPKPRQLEGPAEREAA